MIDFCYKKLFSTKQKDIDIAMQYYAPFEHMIGSLNVDFSKKEYTEKMEEVAVQTVKRPRF